MELRHLRYFTTVVQAGGFSRAARLLHVSQSAISEQIRDLEQELGVPLLDRERRQVGLTPHGSLFLPEALRTLEAATHAVEVAKRSLRGELGTLRIGFFVGGTGSFFAQLIRAFRARSPGVRVTLVEQTPSQQQQALLEGRLDLAFTRWIEPAHHATLAVEKLYVEPLMLVLPPGHALARRRFRIRDLATEPFVVAERATSPYLYDRLIRLCAESGFSPHISASASVAAGVLTLVHAGEGVAILPKHAKQLAHAEVIFRHLPPPGASIDFVAAWRRDHETPLISSFLALMRSRQNKRAEP